MGQRIKMRRDTAAGWTSANTILLEGEIGLDKTNKKLKIGDGSTTWANLPWCATIDYNDLVNKPDLSQFQTAAQVDSAIAGKNYQTAEQVSAAVVASSGMTSAEVSALIAATTIDGGTAAG